jgi:prepilin-type N-terminal cleavage/methylation domain-containing protein
MSMKLRMDARRAHTRSEEGFTLIELLTVMSIMGVLLTLGAFAVRQFWFVQALDGSQSQIASQLKQLQERVVAETHPLVYGARFHAGDTSMGLVRFDPETNSCRQYQTVELGDSVAITSATDIDSDSTEPHVFCKANLTFTGGGAVPDRTSSEFVFFFARGNGTPGTVTIHSAQLDRTETIEIHGITGRVTEG